MSFDPLSAIGGAFGGPVGAGLGSLLGSFLSSGAQSDAANQAAQARQAAISSQLGFQQQAQNQALGFQQGLLGQGNALGQQQIGQSQGLFAPFLAGGGQGLAGLNQFAQAGLGGYQNALQGQQAIAGALGPAAQQAAIAGIQNGPLFSGLARQGEDAILQNASATGGLRGGNTQAALAQFRPQLLNQLLQQQFSNLGGIAGLGAQGLAGFDTLSRLGQAGASGQAQTGLGALQSQLNLAGQVGSNVGNLSTAFGSGISSLLGQQGAVNASNALAQGQSRANNFRGFGQFMGAGENGFGGLLSGLDPNNWEGIW